MHRYTDVTSWWWWLNNYVSSTAMLHHVASLVNFRYVWGLLKSYAQPVVASTLLHCHLLSALTSLRALKLRFIYCGFFFKFWRKREFAIFFVYKFFISILYVGWGPHAYFQVLAESRDVDQPSSADYDNRRLQLAELQTVSVRIPPQQWCWYCTS